MKENASPEQGSSALELISFPVVLQMSLWRVLVMAATPGAGESCIREKVAEATKLIKAQIKEFEDNWKMAENGFPPLPPNHPLAMGNRVCPICRDKFQAGDVLAPVEIEPASEEDLDRKKAGRPYTAACDIAHKNCLKAIYQKKGVEFVWKGK